MTATADTVAAKALDFVLAGLRSGETLAADAGVVEDLAEAADAIEAERESILGAARQVGLAATGKVDPVAITDAVVDGAAGALGMVPVPQVQAAAVLVRGLGVALRLLVFQFAQVAVTATGDLVGVADMRSTERR